MMSVFFNVSMIPIALDKMLFFFNQKILIFFLLLPENICFKNSLEVPHRGTSNGYPQHMFSFRNKEIFT